MRRQTLHILVAIVALVCVGVAIAMLPAARDSVGAFLFAAAGSQAEHTSENTRAEPDTETAGGGASNDAPSDSASNERRTRAARLPVAGVVVEREPFVLTVQGTGRVQSLRRAELSLPVSERIAAVHVRAGDAVGRGQVLVELERRPFEIAFEEAQARDAKARVDFDVQLLGEESVPDDKRLRVAHRTGVTEAQQQLERAQRDLDATVLRAPFDGFVADVQVSVGERLQLNQTIVTVVDLDRLRLPVEVLETDFGRLRPGSPAHVRFPAIPDGDFAGEIVALSPELDAERGTGVAYVELDNPSGRIKPGMYAEVRIAAEVLEKRLAVPRAAVLERDRRLLVFRSKNGRAEWTYVEIGAETDTGIEIASGIAAGDTVLVDGHLTLAHGAPIRVRIEEPRSALAAMP